MTSLQRKPMFELQSTVLLSPQTEQKLIAIDENELAMKLNGTATSNQKPSFFLLIKNVNGVGLTMRLRVSDVRW